MFVMNLLIMNIRIILFHITAKIWIELSLHVLLFNAALNRVRWIYRIADRPDDLQLRSNYFIIPTLSKSRGSITFLTTSVKDEMPKDLP